MGHSIQFSKPTNEPTNQQPAPNLHNETHHELGIGRDLDGRRVYIYIPISIYIYKISNYQKPQQPKTTKNNQNSKLKKENPTNIVIRRIILRKKNIKFNERKGFVCRRTG